MTAARVQDTNYQLPGTSSKTNNTISTYTQIKISNASSFASASGDGNANSLGSGFFELVLRNIGITLTQWSHWNAIYMATHWKDCFGKEDSNAVLFQEVWEKVPSWECLYAR